MNYKVIFKVHNREGIKNCPNLLNSYQGFLPFFLSLMSE